MTHKEAARPETPRQRKRRVKKERAVAKHQQRRDLENTPAAIAEREHAEPIRTA